MNYIKIALRVQSRFKWFTITNIAGLALGILCSIVIFLYVNFHLRTDTHYSQSDRIYRLVLDIHTPNGGVEYEPGTAVPMGKALEEEYSQVERAAFCMRFYATPTITIATAGGTDKYKEQDVVAYADQDFISMFDYHFLAGDPHDALIQPGSVLLSEKQALKYFGNTDVVGRSLNINNKHDLMVTGVFAPASDQSDLNFDVLVSLPTLKWINPKYQDQNFTWTGSNNWTFVQLKNGTDVHAMNLQLEAFTSKHLGKDFSHWDFRFQPLSEMHFDTRYDGVINKSILWMLGGVALALLGMVSVNYINLSIAQFGYRAKEIGVRKYMGGSKAQLFRQFMAETSCMVLASVGIALAGVHLILPVINEWLQTQLNLMQLFTAHNVLYLFLFIVLLIGATGYYPGVVLSGFDPVKAITGKRTAMSSRGVLLKQSLICFQYVAALVFLTSTVVIVSQVNFLLSNDTGFARASNITLALPRSTYEQQESFRAALTNVAGVASASMHNQPPMTVAMDGGFIKYNNGSEWSDFMVRDRWADEHFVDTYALQLIAGRNFSLRDSVTEVLVNEALLKELQITDPDNALGKSILFDNSGLTATITGVIRDFHHRSLQNGIEPLAIYPFKSVFTQVGVRFHAGGGPLPMAAIEAIWKKHFPDDVLAVTYLDQSIARMYQVESVAGKLMSAFAIVSVLICSMGILGLSSFAAVQRTKEIGVRKVLGANGWQIIAMLCRQYLSLIGVAVAIALPLAYVLMHQWLLSFAYHISPGMLLFALPAIALAAITLLLVGVQSWKTAQMNPVESLKQE